MPEALAHPLDIEPTAPVHAPADPPRRGTELDARGRPPPDPVAAIRAAIDDLEPGDILQVRTRAEPIALVLMLASPALAVSAEALPDQTWRMTLHRR